MNNSSKKSSNHSSWRAKFKDKKQEIAHQSSSFEQKIGHLFAIITNGFDKFLFNRKYSKLVAFVVALLLFSVVNFQDISKLYASTLKASRTINDVKVVARYNTDNFEISGLPAKASVILSGDATNLSGANIANGNVLADLTDLSEGEHMVHLKTEGYSDNLETVVNPTTVMVTLKKKTTQSFDVSYDFINIAKMDSKLSLGIPQLENTKVNIRASKDTLDSIAFVKALIDVSNKKETFTQEARLVAYNSLGKPVQADIVPSTVSVKVPVTSNHKTVPIVVRVSGDLPNNKAVEMVQIDQQTVTIYGNEKVLNDVNQVVVTLNGETLSQDATILRSLSLPKGISSASLKQVSMNVKLGNLVTKTLGNVTINYRNNVRNYKVIQPNNKMTTSVILKGTQANVDAIKAEDIYVYIDMENAKPGLQDFDLNIDKNINTLVSYQLVEKKYSLNVLGENSSNKIGENND